MSEQLIPIFIPLLFAVAFLYASVGHGGASGYLALMVIFGFSTTVMKPTALMLNVFVSLVAFLQYYRAGYFKWKLFLPFAIASVPMAFLGGTIEVDANLYKKILGILLIFPIMRLFGFFGKDPEGLRDANMTLSVVIGAGIGFLSGLIGIGGGIILSPLIVLLHYARMKETAGVSALFIFVNSLSGLAGQIKTGVQFDSQMVYMVLVAFAGGALGAYYGVNKFNNVMLKRFLAFVLVIACFKLLSV
ncbi:MAG: sulfite exporter TauE/SafE family protein [Bacteroidetes bacterium]|nr:MAG: sulfite exporter TauE/SafE family protein [Bacteroidota bacterium]REK00786.1 MAG: sulfite exporter TauE/SafE family protein [Bacteroidota bacterium]REK35034.1 MAG: sulfite exporter TauE/SafE family protein [Bacteroidota bacterium]REK48167.1 MAG: sulfite exporter TauE/SafE family protein [Bacteroidota bacterium]